jgi:ACS family hexuronate transporter-like MFS transporter
MSQQTKSPDPALTPPDSGAKPTNFRWVICGLLFYATTVNYIDRSTLNTLEPTLRDIIHWRPYQYGLINAVFSLAYGIGFLVMGALIDKVGTRVGYALAMVGWSLSGLMTAFTSNPIQFGITRFFLGLFEAGNFPAAIKTTAEWFPQKQRATATGIFNAGSNVGAVCAPLIVLFLVPWFGWRAAFFVTPILVVIWLTIWLRLYRPPAMQPRANDAERALIEADPIVAPTPVKWRNILPHRQAWAFMTGKFLTDPIWWFYLFWSGAFFSDKFGVKLAGVAGPLIYIYILADVGSIAGGWLSSTFIKKGWTPNAARKTAMAICAAFVIPVIFAPMVPSDMTGGLWIAATLIGSAAAAHQGFSANIFTTTSDMFPKRAVSSITGLGGLAGALGSVILQSVAGVTIELTGGNYLPLFIVAACAYPLAIFLIHSFAPRLEPVGEAGLESTPMPRAVTALIFAVLGFVIAVPISYYLQGDNARNYRLYDRKTLVSMTFTEKSDELPRDLLKKADIGAADSAAPKVTVDLKRDPTPTEAAVVEDLRKYSNGEYAFEQAKEHFKPGFTMGEYIAAVLPPGNIYKSMDRDKLLPALVYTPLAGLALGALIGAGLHGVLFRRRTASQP